MKLINVFLQLFLIFLRIGSPLQGLKKVGSGQEEVCFFFLEHYSIPSGCKMLP